MYKNNSQNSENIISRIKRNLCREVYSRPPVYQIWRIYLDLWDHDCKKWVWPTFGCKQLWCKSNSTCHATYWMYIPSFKLISQSMFKRSPENADGRTDGRTDGRMHRRTLPRHNTSFFKRAYNQKLHHSHKFTWDEYFCPFAIAVTGTAGMKYHHIIEHFCLMPRLWQTSSDAGSAVMQNSCMQFHNVLISLASKGFYWVSMTTLWHGKTCRFTGSLWEESTGHQWFTLTKGQSCISLTFFAIRFR